MRAAGECRSPQAAARVKVAAPRFNVPRPIIVSKKYLMLRISVIIVAGGGGTRMGGTIPKQFRLLGGRPVLAHTIDRFRRALPAAQLVVVLPAAHIAYWNDLKARFDVPAHTVVEGGAERFHSVRNGLAAVAYDAAVVGVQDAVRPLGSVELIRRAAAEAAQYGSAIPVVEAVDSYRCVDGAGGSRILDRRALRIVQTPQFFRRELLDRAYEQPYEAAFTDDASVVEALGEAVHLCAGERRNLKLTTPDDLAIAAALLEAEADAAAEAEADAAAEPKASAETESEANANAATEPAVASRPAPAPTSAPSAAGEAAPANGSRNEPRA